MNMISIGINQKLAKDIPIFNLPAVLSCPIKSELCKKICYAKRTEIRRKNTLIHRINNYIASLDPNFVNNMNKKLKLLKKKYTIKYFRIHESGDFYNQKYFNSWIKISKENPDITFLAYTRNYKLNFNNLPTNFKVFISLDHTSKNINIIKKIIKKYNLKASLIKPRNNINAYNKLKKQFNNYFICNKDHKFKHNYCGNLCKTCWNYKANVIFLQH